MMLRQCRAGEAVRITSTDEAGPRLRLAELGFVPGARVRVVHTGGAGGLVVAIGDSRVALDAGIAAGVVVEPDPR